MDVMKLIVFVCDNVSTEHVKGMRIPCQNIEPVNSIFPDLIKIAVTIFLALIAGFLALYQMKANIISSSRIRWIEDLRDTLSKLYPVALNVKNAHENHKNALRSNLNKNSDKHYDEYVKSMSDFNSLSNKIKMQLNSTKEDHKAIEDILDRIDCKLDLGNAEKTTMKEIEDDLKVIVSHSKKIFKTEWEKSKLIFKI